MRIPHPRFTVRRMMFLVVVFAVLTTAGIGLAPEVSRRWNACQAAANRHAELAQMYSARFAVNTGLAKSSTVWAVRAGLDEEKVAVHREASWRNWWAFFDPFHECILDRDLY
jgi:hypothetical protein